MPAYCVLLTPHCVGEAYICLCVLLIPHCVGEAYICLSVFY